MTKENLHVWIKLTAILMTVSLVLVIVSIVSVVQTVTQPRIQLENGGIVTKDESGVFLIFWEDSVPPLFIYHEFAFINTADQQRITSTPSYRNLTYSLGAATVNNQIVSGTFGRIIAEVELEAGSYIIEFPPWEASGIFVWGRGINDMFDVIFLVLSQTTFSVLFMGLLFLIVKRREHRRTEAYQDKQQ